ncbi:hypothetical protein CONLIGDRAFT_648973 [Coniochaeta ligniaria NRRL 30616]|uniref:Uncharacterized protein n=1 Tax=Coniochaeta ligniaria NRRL 30616 TaxID=1408157 RepID=A0A1J7I957_9PEZI|nr:hypothetical protein CONLIGDRAFT_648973 [Coniochaeta ligniaria NRRL 30616]
MSDGRLKSSSDSRGPAVAELERRWMGTLPAWQDGEQDDKQQPLASGDDLRVADLDRVMRHRDAPQRSRGKSASVNNRIKPEYDYLREEHRQQSLQLVRQATQLDTTPFG